MGLDARQIGHLADPVIEFAVTRRFWQKRLRVFLADFGVVELAFAFALAFGDWLGGLALAVFLAARFPLAPFFSGASHSLSCTPLQLAQAVFSGFVPAPHATAERVPKLRNATIVWEMCFQ